LGEVTIDCDSLEIIGEEELTQRIVEAFESPGYQPPRLPAVATELLALSNRPDVDVSQIETLLERDAMLAGEILSVCRSAAYDRGGTITSIREALVRIGLRKLREIVMQAAMSSRVFRSATYKGCMEVLQEHSRVTAHIARLVSEKTNVNEEQAFLAGLLHDVGIAGILIVLGDTKRGKEPPDLDALWPAIHGAHGIAGARMVKYWKLPEEIGVAVAIHHSILFGGAEHPLAAVICLAEKISADLGKGFVPPPSAKGADSPFAELANADNTSIDQTGDFTIDRACRALGFDQAAYEALRASAMAWAKKTQGR
jgi:putative nucleotidyltransferase with HDIG domain